MPQTLSFLQDSNILKPFECQSMTAAPICWLCDGNMQSEHPNQTHGQVILTPLSFQLVPQFPSGLKFSRCRADHPPLWSVQFSTGWASLWSEQPSPSLWWVTLESRLQSRPWDRKESSRRWQWQPGAVLAPALPRPLLQLTGPDLLRRLIQTPMLVKGQNAKNPLSNWKCFGTQIQNLSQESDKWRDLLILLSFSLCSSLQERLKQFCFLIFMGILFTSGVIVHLFLPETKGKSIVEITEEFNKLNFKKKRVPATPNHVMEDYTFCTRLWLPGRRQAFLKGRRKRHSSFSD